MKTIDILVPVYNEEDTLEEIIKVIEDTDFCGLEKNIILIDDGSIDKSRDILAKYSKYKVIYHSQNSGKGAAIAIGLKNSTADIVVIQDADLEYNPQDYNLILPYILNNESDVVYGSRFSNKEKKNSFLFLSCIANVFLTFLTNLLYRTKITDMETCYKAFTKAAIDGIEIKSNRYDFEAEITAKITKKGLKIKEVPISYNSRNRSQGKKISAKDGLHAIFALFYYRFFN